MLCYPFEIESSPGISAKIREQVMHGLSSVECYLDGIILKGWNSGQCWRLGATQALAKGGQIVGCPSALYYEREIEFFGCGNIQQKVHFYNSPCRCQDDKKNYTEHSATAIISMERIYMYIHVYIHNIYSKQQANHLFLITSILVMLLS